VFLYRHISHVALVPELASLKKLLVGSPSSTWSLWSNMQVLSESTPLKELLSSVPNWITSGIFKVVFGERALG
jgi:hypothetical protein